MGNLIVSAVLIIAFGGAIAYIINAKRKGVKCVGCPHGGSTRKNACHCDVDVVNFDSK